MSEREYLSLNVSIFYSRPSWHLLLLNGLAPFVASATENGEVNRFIIHFNEQRGQHLRICFEVKKPYEREFLNKLSDYFELYLHSSPSCPEEPRVPITNFIHDFPCNRVFYGLHRLQPLCSDPSLTAILSEQHYMLSQLMLVAFRETVIDADTVETFYLYAGMALLQAFHEATDSALAQHLANRFHYQMEQVDTPISEGVMHQLLTLLQEMAAEIQSSENAEPGMQWLVGWKDFCRRQFTRSCLAAFPEHTDLLLQALDSLALQLNIHQRRSRLLTEVLFRACTHEFLLL